MWALQIIATLCLGTVLEARLLYSNYMPMRTYSSWQTYAPYRGYNGGYSYPGSTYMSTTYNYPRDYRYQYSGVQMGPYGRYAMGPAMGSAMSERMGSYNGGYRNGGYMNGARPMNGMMMPSEMPFYREQMNPSGPTMRGSGASSSRTTSVINDLSRDLLEPASSASGMIAPAPAPSVSIERSSSVLSSSIPSGSLSTDSGLSGSASSGVGVSSAGNVGMVSDASMSAATARGADMRGYYAGMGPSRMDMRGYHGGMGPAAYRYQSGYPYYPGTDDDNGDDYRNGYYYPGSRYQYQGYMGSNPRADYDDEYNDDMNRYNMYRPPMGYRPYQGYNGYMGYGQNIGNSQYMGYQSYMGTNRGYTGYNNMMVPNSGYSYWVGGRPTMMNGGYMYANSVPMTHGLYF